MSESLEAIGRDAALAERAAGLDAAERGYALGWLAFGSPAHQDALEAALVAAERWRAGVGGPGGRRRFGECC